MILNNRYTLPSDGNSGLIIEKGLAVGNFCNIFQYCHILCRRVIISHLMESSEWMLEDQRLYSTVSCINSATIDLEKCRLESLIDAHNYVCSFKLISAKILPAYILAQ